MKDGLYRASSAIGRRWRSGGVCRQNSSLEIPPRKAGSTQAANVELVLNHGWFVTDLCEHRLPTRSADFRAYRPERLRPSMSQRGAAQGPTGRSLEAP